MADAAAAGAEEDLTGRLRALGAADVADEADRVAGVIEEANGGSGPLVAARAAQAFQDMQGAIDRVRRQADELGELMVAVRERLVQRAAAAGLPEFDSRVLSDLAQLDPGTRPAAAPATAPAAGVGSEPAPAEVAEASPVLASSLLSDAEMEQVAQALRVTEAWQDLRTLLAEDPSAAGRPQGARTRDGLSDPPEALAPLHGVLREAGGHASWYRDAPQWQRIKAVTGALRSLSDAVAAAPREYRDEFVRDGREHGFMRTAAARVSRFVGKASGGLATGLEKAGLMGTPQWLALRRLEDRAADFSDQLMGRLPPGWTLRTLDDLRQSWDRLRGRVGGASAAPGDAGPQEQPSGSAVARLQAALADGARKAGERITGGRAWRRLSEVWNAAVPVLSDAHQGVLRFENDAEQMGLLRTAWERTCELASHTARQGMDRLQPQGGALPSPGWHAMRLMRHVAEENIAHLRGDLPPGEHVRLGTFDRRTASRGSAAPAGREGGAVRRGGEREAARISAAGAPRSVGELVKGKAGQGAVAGPPPAGPRTSRPSVMRRPETGPGL